MRRAVALGASKGGKARAKALSAIEVLTPDSDKIIIAAHSQL